MEKAKKRKSFVVEAHTPCSSASFPLNDDAQEAEERKSTRRERIATSRASDRSEVSVGRAKLAKMTSDEKLEHAEKCIQLSAANKISTKNAFHLLLIDQMVDMVKMEEANFQVASTHLDVSAKIYAARVDRVHSDVLRFASGLSSNKPRGAAEDGEDGEVREEEEEAEPEAEDSATAVKSKKKKRARAVIQKDPKTLKSTAHLKGVNLGGLYLQQLMTSQEASEPGNSHFLLSLPVSGDQYKIMLQGEELAFPAACPEKPSESAMRMPDFRVCLAMPMLPDEIQTMLAEGEERSLSRISLLCLPEPDIEEDDDPPAEDFGDNDFADNDGEDQEEEPEWVPTEEVRSGGQEAMGGGTDNVTGAASSQTSARILTPQDYMYLHRAALGLSMGPRDWKPPRPKPSAVIRPAAPKRPRVRPSGELDFTYRPTLFAGFSISNHTQLSEATILGWRRSSHILPMCDPERGKRLQSLWLRSRCTVGGPESSKDRPAADSDQDNGPQVVDLDSSFSRFVFPNDDDHDDDDDDDHDDHIDPVDIDDAEALCTAAAADSQPLNYARRAKAVDMRMLKRCTWDIIEKCLGDKENTGPCNETTFLEIYTKLPGKLSSKMAVNLSPALAFMAVLHLANEHSLELVNSEDLTELHVRAARVVSS